MPQRPLVARNIDTLTPYIPGKPAERACSSESVANLASNENPFGPSQRALEAARAACTEVHRYPDNQASELRQAVAKLHACAAAEVAFGHGSNELIDLIVRTFVTPEQHAVVGFPSFSCYALSLAAANIPVTQVPLRAGLFWDLQAVRAAVRKETKLVFLDNPGNPSSTHIPAQALLELVQQLPDDIVIVVDEAYGEFASAPDFVSALSLRLLRERLIVLRTFSKAYGLAGLRLGYAISTPEIIEYLDRVRVPFNVNGPVQAAALAALEDREHLHNTVAHNTHERARVTAGLHALGLHVAPSQTNFLCVCVERPAAAVYAALLHEGVIVRPFGPPLDRHLRISVGLTRDNDRMLAALTYILSRVAI